MYQWNGNVNMKFLLYSGLFSNLFELAERLRKQAYESPG
jgi:hypothetical protein